MRVGESLNEFGPSHSGGGFLKHGCQNSSFLSYKSSYVRDLMLISQESEMLRKLELSTFSSSSLSISVSITVDRALTSLMI